MTQPLSSDPRPLKYSTLSASPSVNLKGESVKDGRRTTRLQLSDQDRFNIAIKVINKKSSIKDYLKSIIGKFFKHYVEIKDGQDRIFINVNSVSQRLLVKKKEIHQAAKEGTLISLLSNSAKDAEQIIGHYEKNLAAFQRRKDIPTTANPHFPKTLMKIIKTAISTPIAYYAPIQFGDMKLLMGFDKSSKQLELTKIVDEPLGEGTFSVVKIFKRLLPITEIEVLKQAKKTVENAKKDLENEYYLLKTLHQNGKVWGIQEAPRQLVKIKEISGNTEFGYLGAKYQEDLFSFLSRKVDYPFEDHLTSFHQLLFALKELESREILHGDIKDDNIFVKSDSDDFLLMHLADFGGTLQVSDSTSLEEINGINRSLTPEYTCRQDLVQGNELAMKGNREELITLENRRAVFAMGCVLQHLLTNRECFEFDKNRFPKLDTYRPMDFHDIPDEIKELIESMLNPQYDERPSAREAFEIFDDFLLKNYPNVRTTIHQKIEKDFPGSNIS